MTAQYWTMTGYDIWQLKNPICEMKNLVTEEVLQLSVNIPEQFHPVTMPKIRGKSKEAKEQRSSKKKKNKKPVRKGKSKYQGVSRLCKKWRAQFYDKGKKKVIHLGTFGSELLAAAAYQKHIGNHKEARRLRNEYEEGNCMPEEPVVHKNIFTSEQ